MESTLAQQSIRIVDAAPNCKMALIHIALHLSIPDDGRGTEDPDKVEMQLIEQFEFPIQLSSHHAFNPASNFLLVTNSRCTRKRIEAIQDFINDALQMQSDEWNCSLYGGLQYQPESATANPDYVLAQYQGKTIIFLGNVFKFFGSGECSVYELCDPLLVARISSSGSRCLFFDCSDQKSFRKWLDAWVFPVPQSSQESYKQQKASQTFESKSSFCESMCQKRNLGGISMDIAVYTLPVRYPWYDIKKNSAAADKKQLRKYLRHRLPQERFLISAFERGANDPNKQSKLAVLQGLPYSADIIATEHHSQDAGLSLFEAYMIAGHLPLYTALETACSVPPQSADSRSGSITLTPAFASQAIYLSLLHRLNTEIRTFLRRFSRQYSIPIPNDRSSSDQDLAAFFRVHLPTLSHILLYQPSSKHKTESEFSSQRIHNLLTYALASCLPQRKRHITRTVTMPISNHRKALHDCLLLAITRFVLPRTSNSTTIQGRKSPQTTLKEYTAEVKSLHSLRNKDGTRDTQKVIMNLLTQFTQRSTHEFTRGQISARDVVPRTGSCTAKEWDERWEVGERMRAKVRKYTKDAWDVIGTMTVEA